MNEPHDSRYTCSETMYLDMNIVIELEGAETAAMFHATKMVSSLA